MSKKARLYFDVEFVLGKLLSYDKFFRIYLNLKSKCVYIIVLYYGGVNMIFTEMGGRCGNQMFHYAVSRALEEIYGKGITFNFYQIERASVNDATWKNDLCAFNVEDYKQESSDKHLIFLYGSVSQKIVYIIYKILCKIPCKSRPIFYKRQEAVQPILNHFGIYDMVHGYYPLKKSKQKNQFVNGTYEDERFFSDIRDKLLQEFSTKSPLKVENEDLMQQIVNTESVCVSFRRGDFVEKSNKNLRDICDLNYYKEAISIMKEKLPNANFFFFSDDIDWVKKNCDFGVKSFYESGHDDIGEKMRLMSSCKHFIMSNSTFCWWAQYLSQNNNKIVISPDHWFNMDGYKHQLIGEDWILVKC